MVRRCKVAVWWAGIGGQRTGQALHRRHVAPPHPCTHAPFPPPSPPEDPNWLDGTLQDVYKGGKPFTNNVVRVNMLVKTLESSLQVAALMQALDSAVALTK